MTSDSDTQSSATPRPADEPLVAPFALDHANLHVRDVEASLRFYSGTLGLTDYTVMDRDAQGRPTFVELHVGGQLLFLMLRPDYQPPADRHQRGLNHICLRIAPTDATRLQAELRARGATLRGTRVGQDPPTFSVYIEDPDGHGIELEQLTG
jgi:catechol 2,3-dioxygenase-like lactoylglutathione lyase family enzyme